VFFLIAKVLEDLMQLQRRTPFHLIIWRSTELDLTCTRKELAVGKKPATKTMSERQPQMTHSDVIHPQALICCFVIKNLLWWSEKANYLTARLSTVSLLHRSALRTFPFSWGIYPFE
jgi:hypothetical protein